MSARRRRADLWVADPAGKQTRGSIVRLNDPPKAPSPDVDQSILDPTGLHRLMLVTSGGVVLDDSDDRGISAYGARA